MANHLFRRHAVVSACSLAALIVAGCVSHQEATRVHGDTRRLSIKDTPEAAPVARPHMRVDRRPVAAPARLSDAAPARPPVASRISKPTAIRLADPTPAPVVRAEIPPAPEKVAAPAVPSKVADAVITPPAATVIPVPKVAAPAAAPPRASIETVPPARTIVATPPPATLPPVAQPTVSPPAVAAAVPQAAAVPLPTPKPPEAAPVSTPVSTPPAVRPIAEARQAPPAVVKPDAMPDVKSAAVQLPAPAALPRAPADEATTVPVRPLVRQAAIAEPAAPPQAAALSDEQRLDRGLALAGDYMKSGRVVNARSLLEDLAKSGNPAVLAALAESYDPLHLRNAYPKLARTGDGAKALTGYEKAKAAGAGGLDARIDALRALLATRQ